MSKRTCDGCWHFLSDTVHGGYGLCRKAAPNYDGHSPEVSPDSRCGEWQDKNITPEEAEKQDLIRQFALAIVQGWYASDNNIGPDFPQDAWKRARTIVEAENVK